MQIKSDGFHPEAGTAFLYEDNNYKFWFYVELSSVGGSAIPTIIIKDASTDRFAGITPPIKNSHLEVITANIRQHFHTHDLIGRKRLPSDTSPTVKFLWKVGHD